MLRFSQTTGYAVLALSCLRQCEQELVLAKDMARCTGIPLSYLSKMMHSLTQSGLVVGKRGYRGGFRLARPAREVSLWDVVEAVEGSGKQAHCLLGWDDCSDAVPCPLHPFWKTQCRALEKELCRISLHDVAEHERRRGRRKLGDCLRESGVPKLSHARSVKRKPCGCGAKSSRKK